MSDLDAILAEIRELAGPPMMRPLDVTAEMIGEAMGLGRSSVKARMDALVQAGLYETETVFNPETRRIIRVWRRKEVKEDSE